MRGTVAKRLRKLTEVTDEDLAYYEDGRTLRLVTDCSRFKYKQIKKLHMALLKSGKEW